jgi:uncharacterized membrane protein
MNSIRVSALAAAIVLAAVLGVVSFTYGTDGLRVLLALPLVFILPGHALLAAAMPSAPTGLQRFVFAVGLSLAVVVIGGLLLNLVHALTPLGWFSFLSGITLIGYAAALYRRRTVRWSIPLDYVPEWKFPLKSAALYSVAAVAVVLAFTIVLAETQRIHQRADFTEFWMRPERTAEIGLVKLGMRNAEHRPMSYDVELMLNDQLIGAWRNIKLQSNEVWTKTIDLPGGDRRQRLEAWLFKSGDHTKVYRRVWLADRSPA